MISSTGEIGDDNFDGDRSLTADPMTGDLAFPRLLAIIMIVALSRVIRWRVSKPIPEVVPVMTEAFPCREAWRFFFGWFRFRRKANSFGSGMRRIVRSFLAEKFSHDQAVQPPKAGHIVHDVAP